MHAVTAAHNQLSAMLDNHLYQGNALGIDPYNITWRRVLDVNDRALRNIVTTVRSLKAHCGKHKIVPGKPLPPALLAENPDEVAVGAANLRKQIENVRLHGVTPVGAMGCRSP